MKQYLESLKHVLDNGVERADRTGTGTIGVFGYQTRYNLADGFPAVTTKKLAWRAVVSELLWFMEGSGDERRLAEILHGTRDSEKKTIWTANASADYWKDKAEYEGDLGRVYGVQWRNWRTPNYNNKGEFEKSFKPAKETDQLVNLIEGIKNDPYSRRHILSAWNPGELEYMALPPCHAFAQFYVSEGKLSCQLYQRSADMFLGVPFNIASYALLTHMIAQLTGLNVGEFIHTIGDAHIYSNHVEQVKQQLERVPGTHPVLVMPEFTTLDELLETKVDDYILANYKPQDSIKAPMSI